jgi:hypothetical protein
VPVLVGEVSGLAVRKHHNSCINKLVELPNNGK